MRCFLVTNRKALCSIITSNVFKTNQVEVKRNLGYQDFHETVTRFAASPDHGDMSVLIILSHGDNGKIYCSDGRPATNDWILKQFNNANCPGRFYTCTVVAKKKEHLGCQRLSSQPGQYYKYILVLHQSTQRYSFNV